MKCPQCNNELVFREMGGKDYIVCKNCKKVYDPAELFGGSSNDDEPEGPRLALSICSMVFGIIGLLLSCVWIGIFPAAIGLLLGIIALATHHSKGMAIAGVVTSAIGIMIAAFILITGTAASSILENQGLASLDKSKKESVKKEEDSKDNSKDSPETEEPTSTPEPEQPADDNMIDFNMGEYVVKYTGHAIGNDYEGNPCLIIYYDFTNNSNEATTAQLHSYIQAFQNGTECESAFFMDENEAIRNYSTNIQPGVTINVGEPFKISDMSNVTIEASETFSINGEKDTMVIQLQ